MWQLIKQGVMNVEVSLRLVSWQNTVLLAQVQNYSVNLSCYQNSKVLVSLSQISQQTGTVHDKLTEFTIMTFNLDSFLIVTSWCMKR
jgi:hypothetical protein